MDAQPPPARVSNALCLPELLGNTFAHLSPKDGWQAAAVCNDGFGLAGLCITALPDGTGARVWCAGEYWGDSYDEWRQAHPPAAVNQEVPGRAHIFAICE